MQYIFDWLQLPEHRVSDWLDWPNREEKIRHACDCLGFVQVEPPVQDMDIVILGHGGKWHAGLIECDRFVYCNPAGNIRRCALQSLGHWAIKKIFRRIGDQ